jgi:L-cysteine S-thiosulfotransferase
MTTPGSPRAEMPGAFRAGSVNAARRRWVGLAASLAGIIAGAAASHAGECKMKAAGYYKMLETAATGLPSPLESKGIQRSLTGVLGDPQKGRLVVINPEKGNCIACHRVAALSGEPSHGDLGQTLNGVAARYTEAQLRQLIINARLFFPNTVMPSFHSTDDLQRVPAAFAGQTILSAADVEDVVAFLKTLR